MSAEAVPHILGEAPETITCECGVVVKVKGLPPLSMTQCPSCQRKFPVTVRLGQFLLLKRLGQGAMGEVFEAKDITLGRHVAIKVMGKKVSADEETMRSFVREARNLAALNHRNVVQVHSIGVEKGQPYIVMELVPGGRVDQMIQKDVPGDERRLLEIMVDAARGLEAASNAGLIHGDVKPANILIDSHGQAKIVDFGLARFEESQVEGKIYGTPFYLPPELLEGKMADLRSDMYSLGASFFHAFAGRPPFKAKTVKEIVRLRLVEPAPNLRSLVPLIHPQTAAVIARILEKDPAARYATYAQLVADLQLAIREVDAGPVDPALAALHEALGGTERKAARSGRVQRPEVEPAARSRTTIAGTASHRHAGQLQEPGTSSKTKLMIAGGILLVVLIVIIIAATSGKSGGGGGTTPGSANPLARSFSESFNSDRLDPAWQLVDGGGKPLGGVYQIEDRDPSKSPGIKRIIGGGPCTVDVNISKIDWPTSDGAVQVELWDDAADGVLLHCWKAQGKSYLELKSSSAETGTKLLGTTRFDAPPKSIKLRAIWSDQTQRWRITYGINGEAPSTEAQGSPAASPVIRGAGAGRFIQIRTEYYGSDVPLNVEISEVSMQLDAGEKKK